MEEAREKQYAVAVEDLTGLIEAIKELPKTHKVKLIALAYRRLLWWIKWQAAKRGIVVVEVEEAPPRPVQSAAYDGSR